MGPMTKLVVFANRGLNELRRRALRLDELTAAGLAPEYWDLSPLYGGAAADPSAASRPYVRAFSSWAAVSAALDAAGDCVAVPTFMYEPGQWRAYRALSRSRARIARPCLYSAPTPPASPAGALAARLTGLADPGRLRRAVVKRGMLAAKAAGLLRPFDLAIAVGEGTRDVSAGLPRVAIHHPDFDDWRSTGASDRPLVAGRTAVFLDMYYTAHPDHAVEGLPPVDAARYFRSLNAFFGRLEARHGLRVVVAAHPKADYAHNPFEGRPAIRLATRELARFADFAVTTFSASMNYAVLGLKPLFIIDSDEMAVVHKPAGQEAWPRMYADVLGARYVNLDHPADEDVVPRAPDPGVYDAFKYRHLVSRENEGRSTAEVLAAFLKGSERPA